MATTEGQRMSDVVQAGDEVEAKVIRLDADDQKIALSVRALTEGSDAGDVADFVARQEKKKGGSTTLGSLIKEQLEKDK
jgi:ribosomal protein S1